MSADTALATPRSFADCCARIECAGETLLLHHERAVFWPRHHLLLVADVHFGKEQAFARAGVPIPDGPSETDMQRLSALLRHCGAGELCILGDFMHTAPVAGERWLHSLRCFIDRHPALSIRVVAGNHDRHGGRALIDPRVTWFDEPIVEPPFVLQHEPADDTRGYVLSGHLHPAWRLGRRRRPGLRAPAFWFGQRHAVMPAFGNFTGGMIIRPEPRDRIYIAGPDCVIRT